MLEEYGQRTDSVRDVQWVPYLIEVAGNGKTEGGVQVAEEVDVGIAHDGWKMRKERVQ